MRRRDFCAALPALLGCGESNDNDMRFGPPGLRGSRVSGASAGSVIPPAPDDPAAILGSALKWRFDFGDAGNTITGQGFSTVINKGQDVSNFAGDAVQATDGNRPYARYLRGNKLGMQTVAALSARMVATFSGAVASLSAPYTIIRVRQQMATGTMTSFARGTAGMILQTTGTTWPKSTVTNAGTSLTVASAVTQNELAVFEEILGGVSDGAIYKNGILLGSGTTNVAVFNGSVIFGCSSTLGNFDTSHTGEILIVAGKITPTQRAALQVYFAYWYGIGSATHWVPTGDSLTGPMTGCSNVANGWRGLLSADYTRAKKGGKWLCSMGATQNFGFTDDMHYGVGGDTIALSATRIAALFGSGNIYNAPIVFYMIGTNNMSSYVATTTANAYRTNVEDIDSRITTALGVRPYILVTSIPDVDPAKTTQHTNTPLYNAELPGVWTAMENNGLRLVRCDVFSAVGAYNTTDWYQTDGLGVHLSDSGYAKMAAEIGPKLYSAAALAA